MNLLETIAAGALLLIPVILGLLMIVAGLKGIGRMLGIAPPPEIEFFCGNSPCVHEIDEHRKDAPIGHRPCKRCSCSGYVSALYLANWGN